MTVPPLPAIGSRVGYDEVLWWYCRFDFALAGDDPGECGQFGPFAGLRRKREDALMAKIPLPNWCSWRYSRLTREIASRSRLWWAPSRDIEGGIQQLDLNRVGSPVAKKDKISDFVDNPECGTGDGYRTLILVQSPPPGYQGVIDWGPNDYFVIEGTHRLCAVWQKFQHKEWPDLACFLGVPPACFV